MLQKRHIVLLIVCLLAACRNITNQDAVAEIEGVPTETAVLAATIEPTTETADPTVEPTIVPTQIPDPTSAPTITPDPIPDPTATNRLILQGEYLGQPPPGNRPVLFAPGFVSTENGFEFSVTFSPDGTEFYFTRREPNGGNLIYFTELVDGQWKTPTPASFNADYVGAEAIMSPDGMRMFFFARRPLPADADANAQTHYWMTERTETGWSEPEYLAPDMMYVSAANNGTLYFTVANENSPFFLAKMSPTANGYAEPEHLDIPALGSQGIAHPFISPDESYMIFNSIPTETGSLYVVFRQEDDSWSDPIGLGDEINTDQEEFAPLVSPDGNYLFFAREGDIYWVSTEVIEEQRPEELSETGDSNTESSNQLPLQGEYLGQSPPGVTPQIFAPGFVSTDDAYEGSSTFSPDGTEFYFTRIMPDGGYYVLVTKLEDGQWTSPAKASFNPDIVFDGTEAMITPDGSKLFFFSKRPLSGESGN
ncbi:MAG: hypothetical protein GY943_06815, partial [Chloroflexi bacterium]|nr:hypothetical protein [Chloroflexota bacterium]